MVRFQNIGRSIRNIWFFEILSILWHIIHLYPLQPNLILFSYRSQCLHPPSGECQFSLTAESCILFEWILSSNTWSSSRRKCCWCFKLYTSPDIRRSKVAHTLLIERTTLINTDLEWVFWPRKEPVGWLNGLRSSNLTTWHCCITAQKIKWGVN